MAVLRLLLLALVALGLGVGLPDLPAAAQDAAGSVSGTLRSEGEPVEGVTIRAERADGEVVGEATSDADGAWRIPLAEPGDYVVELAPETLPDGVMLRDAGQTSTALTITPGQDRPVIFPFGEGAAGTSAWASFAQRSLIGLKFGLLLGMMAVGLSLIFGTTGLINFAHGELVSLGAVVTWLLNVWAGLHLVVAAVVGIALVALFSGGLERYAFRPLRHRRVGGFQFLIITIGLSLVFQNLMVMVAGSEFRQYAQYARVSEQSFGPFSLSSRDALLMTLAVLILVGVGLFLQRTRMGKALRAVSDNPSLAEASGIDVDRVTLMVWLLGGGLAATGGVFLGLFNNVQYLMGFQFLLLMFAAVILGGLGTAYGAMLGGLLVGYVSEISTLFMRTELKNVWALAVLILVLLVRPQGLLGRRERIG